MSSKRGRTETDVGGVANPPKSDSGAASADKRQSFFDWRPFTVGGTKNRGPSLLDDPGPEARAERLENDRRWLARLETHYKSLPELPHREKYQEWVIGRRLILSLILFAQRGVELGSPVNFEERGNIRQLDAQLTRTLGPETARGLKLLLSASKGHQEKHGTAEEKRARWARYQLEVDAAFSKNPHLSHTELCKVVANRHKTFFEDPFSRISD